MLSDDKKLVVLNSTDGLVLQVIENQEEHKKVTHTLVVWGETRSNSRTNILSICLLTMGNIYWPSKDLFLGHITVS